MYDIIIRNGVVIDGSGAQMRKADVGIKDDLIEEIGDLHGEDSEKVIDAEGRYITPGFIDVNNHSDTYWQLFLEPSLDSLLYQGITTIIGGNCGSSLAPLSNGHAIKAIQKWADIQRVNINWSSTKEFFKSLEERDLSVNFASLVGHSTVRRTFCGDEIRNLTTTELAAAKKLLKQSLQSGMIGFSTGLVYSHAKIASKREIAEFIGVLKSFEGIYTTHLRNEMGQFVDSIRETTGIAHTKEVKTHISHLKVMGSRYWDTFDLGMSVFDKSLQNGADITFDVFPYTCTSSVLYTLLPDWATKGGKLILMKNLKDWQARQEIVRYLKEQKFDYEKIRIAISTFDKSLTEKNIMQIAQAQNKDPEEVIVQLLLASEGRIIANMDVLSEDNVIQALQHPQAIISSDGVGYYKHHNRTGQSVHPRNFGAFPRVLAWYVKEKNVLRWEEAIHKMTGKPAQRFGLRKRGCLKEGYYADIAVVNPETIQDTATLRYPYRYAEGIENLIINGKMVIRDGQYDGVLAGEVLKR